MAQIRYTVDLEQLEILAELESIIGNTPLQPVTEDDEEDGDHCYNAITEAFNYSETLLKGLKNGDLVWRK